MKSHEWSYSKVSEREKLQRAGSWHLFVTTLTVLSTYSTC